MKIRLVALCVSAGFVCVGASTAWADPGAHTMVTPADLSWGDVPSLPAGAKVAVIEGPLNEAKPFTFRLKFPANYKIPPHSHPAIEHVTVISGTFHMGVGDKMDTAKTMALGAGSAAINAQSETQHCFCRCANRFCLATGQCYNAFYVAAGLRHLGCSSTCSAACCYFL